MDDDEETIENASKEVLTLDHVEVEVKACLQEKQSLQEVINELEKKFSRKLSELDCYHVEYKYIDLLVDLWLDEGLQLLSSAFDPRHPLKFFEVLNSVNSFSDGYTFFGTTNTYNFLISDLSEISPPLKSREKEFVCKLKKRCYNYIFNKTDDIKNEVAFVQDFVEVLKSNKNIQFFCQSFELNDILKCAEKNSLKLFLSSLLCKGFSTPKLCSLQNSAKQIYSNNDYFFVNDLRDIILAYLKPVVIKESNADGRLMLEVSGKHIVISNELGKIEGSPILSHVEEVRFVGAGVIHIDADLSSTIWHGKNIVVHGETLIVSEEKCITWDVSGKDADFTATSKTAGTSEDGCGLKGEDGRPGESGGNVCILVESIENHMNLKIISNGGKGSKGQNGGSGRDGQDGEYIDVQSFKEDFPPVSHLQHKEKNYMITMDSVCQSLLSVDKFHYGLSEFDQISIDDFKSFVKQNKDLKNIYFETTTKEGCKIFFSFHNEGFFSCCQSLLLHKGGLGTEGKLGGAGGCGGKGGFAGGIKIQAFKDTNLLTSQSAENGADGGMGTPGAQGNPGKSGLDRGYMDCTLALFHSIFYSVEWPKIFIPGPRDCNRLTVKFYSEEKPDRVKCPYNGAYAEIAQIKRTHLTEQLYQRREADVFKKYEHKEISAIRKKNISQTSILQQYHDKDTKWNIYNFENALEIVQGEIEELNNDTFNETEKITQEAKITRQISYCQNDWYLEEITPDIKLQHKDSHEENEDHISSPKIKQCKEPVPVPLLSIIASTASKAIKSSFLFTTVSQTINQLQFAHTPVGPAMTRAMYEPSLEVGLSETLPQFMFPLATPIHESSPNVSETQYFSHSKYCLDKMESIYLSISHHLEKNDHFLEKNFNMKSLVANTIFLSETHSVVSDANQESLHLIEQLFCEDSKLCRQEVVRKCNEYSLNEQPLQEALMSFICESAENDTTHKAVSELGKHHNDFNTLKELRLKEKLIPLKKELLSNAKNKHLCNYVLDGVLKQCTESKLKFENEITQDKFVSYLYRSFVDEMKNSFNWEMEHLNKNVLCVFRTYLMERGPFATSFREFLAYHYNVNILIYSSNNENDRFRLVSNHNPTARPEIHFLMKKNKFVKLNFDYEFARLFEKYKRLGNVLDKIMFHFGSFTNKQQIDDYVTKSPFTSLGYNGLASSEVVVIKINHILDQENYVKSISTLYAAQEDTIWVKCRLEKLKAEFIGYENILHYMALHFEVEGNKITASELGFVINQILKFSMEESKVMSLVSWIIAAQPQQLWVLELALLKLELYFKSPLRHEIKLKWREYFRHQTERSSLMIFLKKLDCETCQISVDSVDELLFLMGNVPKAHTGLENINISEWKYHLKDRFWAHRMQTITNWSEEQLKSLSFYLLTWENSVGMEPCLDLVEILKQHANEIKTELDKNLLLTIFKSLNSKEVCFNAELWSQLSEVTVKKWQNVIDSESMSTGSERSLQQLVKLIVNSGNTSKNILDMVPGIESTIELTNSVGTSLKKDLSESKLKRLFLGILNPNKSEISVLSRVKSVLEELLPDANTFDKTQKVIVDTIKLSTQSLSIGNITKSPLSNLKGVQSNDQYIIDLCTQKNFLPLIELCVGLKHEKWLRNTQKLTVMTLLTNSKNTLAQVSTGEGKSLVVVTLAIIKALANEKVNIITSSKVLAKRDAEMYKDIYELCGLTVGHNSSENIEERRKVYSNCQVIYGDLANFQRDYLLDRVYNQNILGDSSFQTVIIDEVDSMLLDKGNNALYLSHDIPGLDKIEPVFIYIWKWISRPVSSEQFEDLFSVQAIKEKIMYEIFGVISKDNLKQLDTSMTEKQVDCTWECLIAKEVISRKGKVLKESVNSCNIDGLPESCIPKIHLKYVLEKVINREKIIHVPQYLQSFVEDHLESWIKSGVSAMVMESGRDYIVDVDRSGTVSDRNPIITILDRDTGADLVNSQWDEAVHQFLQLKHGCKLSLLSLKAVFISNVSYLRLYKTLYGLTGTLGSTCERELLQEVYGVDFVTIPTAKAKKFCEEPPTLCSSTEEWKQKICEEVSRITRKKRSALIICETIKDVFTLKEKLCLKFSPELILSYTRDYESLSVADSLKPGNIIISTNLAGRGTDIKLSKQLIDNGGLYVCLTFLPSNYRVEEQAYGRAARNGEPGTAQLIFRSTRQSASHSAARVIDVKKQRDINELKRLADIKSYHETQIKQEEKWFGKFRKAYDTLKKLEQTEDVKHILLQTFLNQWAFWLDKNKKHLVSTSNSQDICRSLENVISGWTELESEDLEGWLKLITDPTQLVKLGLFYLKKKEFSSSLRLFNKVIEEEPYFSEIAHYYTVFVNTQQKDYVNTDIVKGLVSTDIQQDILEPLKVIAKKLKERAESSKMSGLEINWLKEQDKVNLVQIDSFLDQQRNISKIFEVILQSINNILGNEIFPEIFIIPTLIDKHMAEDVYKNVMRNGLLTKPTIKSNIKNEELLFVRNYGLSPSKMNLFINQFEGEEYQEDQFLVSFERDCVIPSRETFWEELVKNQVLVCEESYVFIDMEELHLFHPSLCQRIEPNIAEKCVLSNRDIWLYQPEELEQMKGSKTLSYIQNDKLVKLIGSNLYQLLENKEMFIFNKLAAVYQTNDIVFSNFDAISKEDFQTIDICEETASKIIEDLINQHVIKEKPTSHPGLYYLLIDAENIEQIELTKHKAYTYDVRSLMSVCFAFRIAFEKLKLLTMQTCENISLPLQVKLHKRIVLELKENEIIRKAYVDVKADVSNTLDGFYPKCMSKNGYKTLLLGVCCDMSCDSEIEILIKNRWLIKEKGCSDPQNETYYINPSIKSLINTKTYSEKFDPQLLDLPFHPEKDTIRQTVLNRFNLIEHLDHLKTILTSSRGQYLLFETPSLSLTPLLDVLLERKLSSEIEIFALNGFDQLIVLEEKKWTLATQCNILCIVVFGVCQIAVGAVLEALFPANLNGLQLIAGGMSDLIFAVSCCFSGHCSLKNYLLQKVISTALTWSTQLCTLFRSAFGQKVTGMSFQSIKQGFTKAFGLVSGNSTVGKVVKNCSVRIVTAISQGLIYSAVDHVIESQLDKISLAITELFNYNINKTVDNHSVTAHIKEICSRYGPDESKKIIGLHFSKHIGNPMDMFSKSLSNTVTLIYSLIKLNSSYYQKDKKTTPQTAGLDYLEVLKIIKNFVKVFEESRNLFDKLVKQINDVLDMIEKDLKNCILEGVKNKYRSPVSISEKDLISFTSSVCDDWKTEIKNKLSNNLNKIVLSPVLQFVTSQFVHSSSTFLLKKSKAILRVDDVRKQNVSGYKRTQAKKRLESAGQTSDESGYEECLLDLLKKNRNVATFTEIMRKNVPIDTNYIEMCCFILPKALRNEGIVLPNLEIIVERNGTYQRFSMSDEKCEKTTIIIAPDSDLATNVFRNKTLVQCGVDLILTKISQDHPVLSGYPIEGLRSFVAEKIENAFGTQRDFPTIHYELPYANNHFKINVSAEHKCPYQHFHVDGTYFYNMKVDVDLRTEEKPSFLNPIEDQILKGFICALNKINSHIHKVQYHLRHFRLSLEDFEETNYEIVPRTNKASKGNFHCFPTHYKLVMPFVVEFSERGFEDFTISMSLNNQVREKRPYLPFGPHITYEISPKEHFKHLNKGTKGHVLINEACSGHSFSAKNCHIAGELILPTGLQLQKTCRVLILGDSMFEVLPEIVSYPNFVAISYSNLSDLKSVTASCTMFYKGFQCVVLIPRISLSLSRMSVGEITMNIAEVIEKIQDQFGKTKIVVCSLLKAKGESVGKITQTNKCLKLHCSRMNVQFLETNGLISSDELEDSGIHLNKRGLKKIVQSVL